MKFYIRLDKTASPVHTMNRRATRATLRALLGGITLLVMPLGLVSCLWHSHTALKTAQTLKTDTLDLMGKATQPYATHAKEVYELDTRLNTAVTAEESRPNNKQTVAMWKTLLATTAESPGSGIYARYKEAWERKSTLKATYIAGKQRNVGTVFDKIIAYEQAKAN